MVDRLKMMPMERVVEFTDDEYQSQLPDHQRSTAVQAIRNNLKSSELQLCDSLATRRQLVRCCSHCRQSVCSHYTGRRQSRG